MKKYLFTLLVPILLSSCSVTKIHEIKDPLLTEAKNNFYGGNYKAAAKDLHALAKAGDPEAQYALGYMYYYGMGVDKNNMIARRLISLSAEKGNIEAIKALRVLTDSNHIFANVDDIAPNKDYDLASKQKGKVDTKVAAIESKPNIEEQKIAKAETQDINSNEFKDITKKDMENTFKLVKFGSNKPAKVAQKPSVPTVSTKKAINPVNSWLAKASADAYTIQLAANKNKKVIDEFIKQNNLVNKAKVYTYNYNNEQWYAVSLGVYNEPAAAFNVLTKLPNKLKANKPWVRQLSNIKKEALALTNVPGANRIG